MGKEKASDTQVLSEQSLIDFLYVDKERADSFISQIRNGTLRSATKTTGTSEGSSISAKGSVKVAEASTSHTNMSKAKAAEEYDPYHSQLIQLLNDLGVEPTDNLPVTCAGKLMLMRSQIKIHDFESIKSIMPIMSKNLSAFGFKADRSTRDMMRMLAEIISQMSDSISLTLDVNGINVTGTLKSAGLSITQSDIGRTYGIRMPGEWYTLGIVDTVDIPAQPLIASTIEDAIDIVSSATGKFFSQTRYKVIPILVFRIVDMG